MEHQVLQLLKDHYNVSKKRVTHPIQPKWVFSRSELSLSGHFGLTTLGFENFTQAGKSGRRSGCGCHLRRNRSVGMCPKRTL